MKRGKPTFLDHNPARRVQSMGRHDCGATPPVVAPYRGFNAAAGKRVFHCLMAYSQAADLRHALQPPDDPEKTVWATLGDVAGQERVHILAICKIGAVERIAHHHVWTAIDQLTRNS